MVGRYHKEGTDPHRQKPNNGNLTGDKESNAKDSGGGNKTRTGGLNRDDRDHEGRDNGTKTGAAKRKKKPRSGTGSSTKDLNGTPDSANNKLHPTSFQRAGTGTERRRVKEDAENRTDQHEDPDTRQRRDPHGGATRQRRHHRIGKDSYTEDTDARDDTAKDTGGYDTYPLVDPRPEEAPDNGYGTIEQSAGTKGSTDHTRNTTNKTLYPQRREPHGGATSQGRPHRDAKDSHTEDANAKDDTTTTTGTTDKDIAMNKTPHTQRRGRHGEATSQERPHRNAKDNNTKDNKAKDDSQGRPHQNAKASHNEDTDAEDNNTNGEAKDGTKTQQAKKDDETYTEKPKAHKDSDTKNPTGKAARGSAERQNTMKEDTGGGHHDPRKTPTGKTAKGHARRRARDHRRRSKTTAGKAKAGTERQRSKKDADTNTEMPKAHKDSDTKTPTGKAARDSGERQDTTKE